MKYQVREATVDDAVLVADISRRTFADTFAAANTEENMRIFLDEQFTRGKLMLEVGRPEHTFFLVYAGKELAGYAKLKRGRPPKDSGVASAIEIARLYAARDHIGHGVGNILMQACITQAKDEKAEAVWLGVWEQNPRAIRFYERWGFQKFAEVDFLLGKDLQRDWLMIKKIEVEGKGQD